MQIWAMMRQTNEGQNRGIQWTLTSSLEDLVFADISMLSSRHRDIQDKSDRLTTLALQLGMNIQVKKTKIMKMNTNNSEPVIINNQHIEEVDEFTYLGSKVSTDGDSGKDVQARLAKANQAFGSLNAVWKSKQLRVKTKIRIFKSNVLSVLLYGSECWKMTKETCKKLDTFQTKCLRRIRRILWPEKIKNEDLHKSCNMEPISACVKRRRLRWLGHVLRLPNNSLARMALRWTPQGKRKRGRPKITWRRSVEAEPRDAGPTWETASKQAKDRQKWRSLAEAPCAT